MRRIAIGLVVAVLFLALSGCLQTETTVHLNRDGSGTIEQRFVMQSDILAFIVGMSAAGGGSEGEKDDNVQDFGFIDENELRDAAAGMGDGVTLKSVEPIAEDGFSGYQAIYEFVDINAISLNQNPGEVVPTDNPDGAPVELVEFDYNNRSLKIMFPVSMDEPVSSDESIGNSASADSASAEDIEMIKQIYSSLKIGMYIIAEDGLTSTDASYRDGDTVTLMEMDFSKILDDEKAFNELIKNEPESIEEIKDLIERVPGIKVETKETITLKLK